MDDGVIGGKYKIGDKIKDGSISEIFKGVDIQSGEHVAIKRQLVTTTDSPLVSESKMYNELQQEDVGIPSYKWFGEEGGYRYLVIQLLGPSLEDLLKHGGHKGFSLKTVLMIADQVITTIRHMHSKLIIHCHIKPEHLLMGVGSNANKVYLIDFGLAKFYMDPESNEPIPWRSDLSFVGSHCFASVFTHFGLEHSRRDDGLSLCYVLMYLLQGSLPWQGLIDKRNEEGYHLKMSKEKLHYTELKVLKELYPPEIAKCIQFSHVHFNETPYFWSMKNTVLDRLEKYNDYKYDFVYDWTKVPEEEDNTKLGTSSEKPKRILDTGNCWSDSSDTNSDDDLILSEDMSNDPDKPKRSIERITFLYK